jgi:hypothetical protein
MPTKSLPHADSKAILYGMKASHVKLSALAMTIAIILGCGGGGPEGTNSINIIEGVSARIAPPDSIVKFQTTFLLNTPPIVRINDVTVENVSVSGNVVSFQIPAEITPGNKKVRVYSGTDGLGQFDLTIGEVVAVEEVEPNDLSDGSNATPVPIEMKAKGELSSVSDRDFFMFGSLYPNLKYRVLVTPQGTAGNVTVNGKPVALSGVGEGLFQPTSNVAQIGLSQGEGSYTVVIKAEL